MKEAKQTNHHQQQETKKEKPKSEKNWKNYVGKKNL